MEVRTSARRTGTGALHAELQALLRTPPHDEAEPAAALMGGGDSTDSESESGPSKQTSNSDSDGGVVAISTPPVHVGGAKKRKSTHALRKVQAHNLPLEWSLLWTDAWAVLRPVRRTGGDECAVERDGGASTARANTGSASRGVVWQSTARDAAPGRDPARVDTQPAALARDSAVRRLGLLGTLRYVFATEEGMSVTSLMS